MKRLYYILFQNYASYYDENKNFIANNWTELSGWFRSQNGVIEVIKCDPGALSCDPYLVFCVNGMSYLPTFFYAGGTTEANRLFGRNLGLFTVEWNQLCNGIATATQCPMPNVGYIEIMSATCNIPEVGYVEVVPQNQDYAIASNGNWTVDQNLSKSTVNLTSNQIIISISTSNPAYNVSGNPPVAAEIIGVLDPASAPLTTRNFNNAYNSSIPVGATVHIANDGSIKYDGPLTSQYPTGGVIQILNLIIPAN